MDIAYELMGTNLFFTIMYDTPAAMQYLVNFLADALITLRDACIEAAGGIENITSTGWDGKWFPKKGYISNDLAGVCILLSFLKNLPYLRTIKYTTNMGVAYYTIVVLIQLLSVT